jgi:hypothetical protein
MRGTNTKNRIQQIKSELQAIEGMRPGSLNRQYTVCGKENCRCKDPAKPRKHGPYYQLSYVHQGKSTSQYIQKDFVKTVKKQLVNYKKFKALMNEWVDLALNQAKEDLRLDKDRLAAESQKETSLKRRSKSREK